MGSAENLAIGRLRVSAPRKDVHWLVQDMRNAGWSRCDCRAWVFIRQVRVSGDKSELRRRASLSVAEHIGRAVHGRSPGAAVAGAVKFDSYDELLVFLLRDMLRGDAARKWYWQRWTRLFSQGKSRALARLLWEEAEYLPAMCDRLLVTGEIRTLWRLLAPQAAAEILKKISRQLPPRRSGVSSPGANLPPTGSRPAECPSAAEAETRFTKDPRRILLWLPACESLVADDPRIRLAAVVEAMRVCPLLLEENLSAVVAGFCASLAIIAEKVPTGPSQVVGDPSSHFVPQEKDGAGTALPAPETPAAKTGILSAAPRSSGHPIDAAVARAAVKRDGLRADFTQVSSGRRVPGEPEVPPETVTAVFNPARNSGAVPEPHPDSAGETREVTRGAEQEFAGEIFFTDCGGLFYLINALVLGGSLEFLRRNAPTHSGWLWLYQLGCLFEPEWDPGLLRFLAGRCGFETPGELASQPPFPAIATAYRHLEERFGAAGFRDKSLLRVPAQVFANASHLDVFYSPESVRLPLRLAGLDVNPGWVSWLGQVVTLHYSGPANPVGGGST